MQPQALQVGGCRELELTPRVNDDDDVFVRKSTVTGLLVYWSLTGGKTKERSYSVTMAAAVLMDAACLRAACMYVFLSPPGQSTRKHPNILQPIRTRNGPQ